MFAASKSARSGATNDPNFSYVSLLLNGDGTNGKQNNTFLDSSANNFTITRNGTPTQGSFSPYGDLWSNYFNGSSDYFTGPTSANLALGAGDFTVEFWAYLTANPSGAMIASCRLANGGSSGTWGIYSNSSGKWVFQEVVVSPTTALSSTTSPVLNTWTHVAIVRSGTSLKIYLNGVLDATGTSSTNFSNSAYPFRAMWDTTSTYTGGYLSNFRIVKGTAVYTSNFTPSTAPLTAITNTQLLICQSNRFRDASSNAFTITPTGTPSVQRFSPFEPTTSYTPAVNGGSGYFNGSSDYLSFADNAAFQFGSGDFTIECWAYFNTVPTTSGNHNGMLSIDNITVTRGCLLLTDGDNAGKVNFTAFSGATAYAVLSTAAPAANTWHHIAVVRNGTALTLYLNGVSQNTTTIGTASVNTVTANHFIGALCNGGSPLVNSYMRGILADIRIVKGTAVYTSAFTPPTAPLTAVTNTSLLTNFTNAGISDAAATNDLTTVGDAQVSTTVVKYGTASMKFDGTGDYLQNNGNTLPFTFGTSDFTIEMWAYFNNVTTSANLYEGRPASTNGAYPVLYVASSTLRWYVSSVDQITSSAITTGTWYHIAVCRASGSTRLFINGTQSGSTYSDSTVYLGASNRPLIGTYDGAAGFFNGYIDDLRITKGLARYTANFTPPTAALPTF